MTNDYLSSEEAQKMIAEVTEKMNPLLVEGRTYFSEITRDEHGSSGGNVSFFENGAIHRYGKTGNYSDDEFMEHVGAIEDTDFRYLIRFFPVHAKVKFTFSKGEPIRMEQYTVAMFLEDIKENIENDHYRPEDKIQKKELLVSFTQEADELGMFMDTTEYYEASMRSFDFMSGSSDLESIYHLLGGKLDRFYFKYENGVIAAQSSPAFEEHGLPLLTVTSIEVSPEYSKRKEAFEEGQRLRHAFFRSLGTLDDRIIYLRVGGFRDHSWPENSTSHNSCKMRVIHTPETTILITDGLTDIYTTPHQDENLEYNGIGAEFYMEFYGQIPYEVVHKHFAMALVNSVSQVALGHGEIKQLMLAKQYVSVEFTEENIELWVNRENHDNHNCRSFLTPEGFLKDDCFGVMLGMESKLVPQRVQLNLEEVLMINIKPVDSMWLKASKLRSEDDDVAKVAREAIISEWKEKGEWNLVPLTYQKEYVQGNPESGGMVLAPLFPF
ncbi:hypothetical protein H9Y05_00250 [Crocinitomicaceae bacterium CZZ-1]|uniref:Uncharacterized protein n=1 Tax=Taishania pollutisoli TaxID=2766479 RepID=A0A8J6P3S9_9FLAO|nr:hypothetical protein [Taishania pollutisoli]MBC9810894.1 hypothetical protein [Taishania pollutisoli]NGF76959.1 hypothetical protein [Fluviicola sp. SGL-29]